jgi:hypothetical protein
MAAQRANAAANQNIARAHLGLQRAQLDATLADKKAKRDEKGDAEIVRDDKGDPIGRVPTGRGGAQGFATRDADYHRAEKTLVALISDVEQNGGRVFTPEAVKRRNTLSSNAIIGVATVSPLGKTNEAQELEAKSIGSSGAYTATGANLDALKRKLDEIKSQRQQYRTQTLRPLDEEGAPAAASAAPKRGAKAETPKKAPKQNGADASTVDQAKVDRAWKTIDDPKKSPAERKGARNWLISQGQIQGG